jgi:hypothetical protein
MYSEQWVVGLRLGLCCVWEETGRPYYNVYPVVIDALSRTSLSVTVGQMLGELANKQWGIAACFAVGHEPIAVGRPIKSMLINHTIHGDDPGGGTLWIQAITLPDGERSVMLYHMDLTQKMDQDGLLLKAGQKDDVYELCARLAVGILMLAQDVRFVERVLLSRDRGKALSPEEEAKAIDRAISRTGRQGYTIGRDWMASPHIRRPHFGVRWTGTGRTIPKLVPVKGSLVRKSDLLEVPTGYVEYEDEDPTASG